MLYEVITEYFPARGVPLLLFGAGHVAKALLPILSQLPLQIRWIDSREEQFPAELPSGVQRCLTDNPVEQIEQARPGSYAVRNNFV